MQSVIRLMFALLADGTELTKLNTNEIGGFFRSDDTEAGKTTEAVAETLFKLSAAFDCSHLVGLSLYKNDLLSDGEIKRKFESQIRLALFRYETQNAELDAIKEVFEKNDIDFIPLKGAVIRNYYPEPWLRQSCDIDILVKETDVLRAINTLEKELGYNTKSKNYHDYTLFSESGVHLELHFNIKENTDKLDEILKNAWNYARQKDEKSNEYVFSNEFLLFHLYAHTAYHFLNGGCGIKPVLDDFILKNKLDYDEKELNELLAAGGIKEFADKIGQLGKVWFLNEEHSELTQAMEKYILSGGVYGSGKNKTVVLRTEKKGKTRSIASRLWLPYKNLVIEYPSLKGKRILQPFYEFLRWCRLFKKDVRKRTFAEIRSNAETDEKTVQETEKMLKELNLKQNGGKICTSYSEK